MPDGVLISPNPPLVPDTGVRGHYLEWVLDGQPFAQGVHELRARWCIHEVCGDWSEAETLYLPELPLMQGLLPCLILLGLMARYRSSSAAKRQ